MDEHQCIEAAISNSSSVLYKIKEFYPNLDLGITTKMGSTTLHLAAWGKATRTAKALLEMKCPKDAIDSIGRTALNIAAGVGAREIVKELIISNCNVLLGDSDGNTALHIAVLTTDYDIVDTILGCISNNTKESLLKASNKKGQIALHLAVLMGIERIVHKLIANGADPSALAFQDLSPLHYAALNDQRSLIEVLLDYTEDTNPKDRDYRQPLHYAALAKNSGLIRSFLAACTKFVLPVEFGQRDKYGHTPLYIAADNGDYASSEILFSLTPVSTFPVPDVNGDHLIHLAARSGDTQLVRNIIEQKHDIASVSGYGGQTPLQCAILNGQHEVFQYLLPLSLSCLDTRDDSSRTPLLAALEGNHSSMVRQILEHNPDINVADSQQDGALHHAAYHGNQDIFKLLLESGCRTFQGNALTLTPLHIAA